jgi:Carboxypeptidase regulatory-like domain
MRRARAAVVVIRVALLAGAVYSQCANAQVPGGVLVTGHVRGPDGRPVAGASVRVTPVPVGPYAQVTADGNGEYHAIERGEVDRMAIDVRALGFAPAHVEVVPLAGTTRVAADVELALARHVLDPVVTEATREAAPPSGPGESAHAYSGDRLRHLPVAIGDSVATIGALVPGGVAPNGQQRGSTAFTYDGTAAGLRTLPPEAIADVAVTPNGFDVGAARSAGSQVAVTTQSGRESGHGALAYTLADHALELGAPSSTVNGFQSTSTLDAAYGGPLIRHRLLAFGAVNASHMTAAATSLLSANPTALDALGVSPDSVHRLTSILATLGAPVALGIARTVTTNSVNSFGRLDATPSPSETVTLTAQGQGRWQTGGTVAPTALPSTGVTQSSWGASAHLVLASRLTPVLENEAGIAVARYAQSSASVSDVPNGTVTVASTSSAGSAGVAALAFGGSGSSAQRSESDALEVDERVAWTAGDHHVAVGGRVSGTRSTFTSGPNAYGEFAYTSLADLAAGLAGSFTRTATPVSTEGATVTPSLYLSDRWDATRELSFSVGVRVEQTQATALPPYNGAIDSTFHIRTDRLPAPVTVDPALGFRWAPGGGDTLAHPARVIVSGGVSLSSASVPGAFAGSVGQPTTQLVCTGAATPTPAWSAYAGGAGAIPTACVGGSTPTAGARPTVSLFDPRDPTPRALSGALSVARPLGRRVMATVSVSGVSGRGVGGASDLNLSPVAQFTLPEEGNRSVYVSAASIDPGTGAVSVLGSRTHASFGQVLALTSRLEQEGGSVSAGLTVTGTDERQFAQLSYGITGSRQQAFYPTPLAATWASGPTDGQQQLLLVGSQPIGADVDVAVIGSLTSGSRFTPEANEDVTGTGAQVPAAFVFDPVTTRDTGVASAMRTLLGQAPANVRDCLRSQLGHVAGLNSCVGPWQPVLNLQVNVHPGWFGRERRLTVSFIVNNVLTGLDAVVHGPNHLAGWGDPGTPDPVLLYVQGFDPVIQAFRYTVNARFGTGLASRAAFGVPAQLVLRGRLVLGH